MELTSTLLELYNLRYKFSSIYSVFHQGFRLLSPQGLHSCTNYFVLYLPNTGLFLLKTHREVWTHILRWSEEIPSVIEKAGGFFLFLLLLSSIWTDPQAKRFSRETGTPVRLTATNQPGRYNPTIMIMLQLILLTFSEMHQKGCSQ